MLSVRQHLLHVHNHCAKLIILLQYFSPFIVDDIGS
jgi:hypothetical protein